MRQLAVLMLSIGLLNGSVVDVAHSAGIEGRNLSHEQCVTFARERKKLEKSGIRKLLAMVPGDVLSQFGQDGERRVYDYISLSEKVLFQCPPHVLNANVASAGHKLRGLPPLPLKGPRRPKLKRPQRAIVPLPVRAPLGHKKRFRIPKSQG